MNLNERNSIIIDYLNKKIIELQSHNLYYKEEQKQALYSYFLKTYKSVDETIKDINKYINDIYERNNIDITEEEIPLMKEKNAKTYKKEPPKFGTIDKGYSHMVIISLIVIIIIFLIVTYLAYLTINKN